MICWAHPLCLSNLNSRCPYLFYVSEITALGNTHNPNAYEEKALTRQSFGLNINSLHVNSNPNPLNRAVQGSNRTVTAGPPGFFTEKRKRNCPMSNTWSVPLDS